MQNLKKINSNIKALEKGLDRLKKKKEQIVKGIKQSSIKTLTIEECLKGVVETLQQKTNVRRSRGLVSWDSFCNDSEPSTVLMCLRKHFTEYLTAYITEAGKNEKHSFTKIYLGKEEVLGLKKEWNKEGSILLFFLGLKVFEVNEKNHLNLI